MPKKTIIRWAYRFGKYSSPNIHRLGSVWNAVLLLRTLRVVLHLAIIFLRNSITLFDNQAILLTNWRVLAWLLTMLSKIKVSLKPLDLFRHPFCFHASIFLVVMRLYICAEKNSFEQFVQVIALLEYHNNGSFSDETWISEYILEVNHQEFMESIAARRCLRLLGQTHFNILTAIGSFYNDFCYFHDIHLFIFFCPVTLYMCSWIVHTDPQKLHIWSCRGSLLFLTCCSVFD